MNTHFFKLNNIIQDYAWGSKTALNTLFDIQNPQNKPQAELWMGAHANGCSKIEVNGEIQLLSDFINQNKDDILGQSTNQAFGELPYLFKVLCAENALSVQVHPSKIQAETGFEKEEKANIPLTASHRNYKDPNHKPELVFALTEYTAMNGFRHFAEIIAYFDALNIEQLNVLIADLKATQNEANLARFFGSLLAITGTDKNTCLDGLLTYASMHQGQFIWDIILTLAEQYPGDIGLFSPLILNTIVLQPGEAMFLDACTPHAYIKGTGLEIMANSDNVLRAGLTPKHMDISELIACTRCQPLDHHNILLAPEISDNALHYPIPVEDFKFSVYQGVENQNIDISSAEIIFAIDADVTLTHQSGESIQIKKGESVFIPAYSKAYEINSQGKIARAYN